MNLRPALAMITLAMTPVDARLGLFGGGAEQDSAQVGATAEPITEQASSCQKKGLDICIAVDRSGSICAPPGKSSYRCK